MIIDEELFNLVNMNDMFGMQEIGMPTSKCKYLQD